jgi:predicted TIM-barrel fold metal-dependent hydrolase
VTRPIIDTCVHHEWGSYAELLEYFDPDWRRYVGTPGTLPGGAGGRDFFPKFRYPNPAGDHLADGAATSPESLADRHLGPGGVERALLVHDTLAMLTPATPNPFLAAAAVRAINDWTIGRWLSHDDLYGTVLVPTQTPVDAAAEIRRVGSHPRMAAILLAASGTGKLLGHPLHDPIFEAAAELDLPVILHRGGDAVPDLATGVAGGPPSTFAEYSTLAPLAPMSHLFNLISNGVLGKYPNLRLYVAGAGVSWVPGLIRRMELAWKALRREVPWVQESPRETFRRQVRVSTYGIERDAGADVVRRIAETYPDFEQLLCYGSGYPAWDTALADDVTRLFPAEWHDRLLFENAAEWFRWATPGAERRESPATLSIANPR